MCCLPIVKGVVCSIYIKYIVYHLQGCHICCLASGKSGTCCCSYGKSVICYYHWAIVAHVVYYLVRLTHECKRHDPIFWEHFFELINLILMPGHSL